MLKSVPGELVCTSNPQTVRFNGVQQGMRTWWIRGYSVVGAPMGASAPLFPQLVVRCTSDNFKHPDRQSTNAACNGFPLTLTGANTYHEYEKPRLFGSSTLDFQQDMLVQVVTPANAVDDGSGGPLFVSLVLDLVFDQQPIPYDPAVIQLRRDVLQDVAYPV